MAEENSDSNVVTRGLGAIRDAFTGQSDNGEQAQDTARTDGEETSETSRRTAEAYADTMQRCAAGDLTVRMEENGGDEAMNRIAVDFNGMVTELEQTTSHLKSYVEEVEGAGIGIERSADTVGGASDNVIDSMEKIAGDAGSQRAQLAEVSESLDDVAAALERVATDHPDAELEPQIDRLEANAATLRDVAGTSETIQSETKVVSAAVAELAAELNEVSSRAADLQRYANPLQAMLDRFETDSENESLISEATAGE